MGRNNSSKCRVSPFMYYMMADMERLAAFLAGMGISVSSRELEDAQICFDGHNGEKCLTPPCDYLTGIISDLPDEQYMRKKIESSKTSEETKENRLICSTCTLEKGRHQFDKIDNSYGHDGLWDANFRTGDYIDFPRGRVVWDVTNDRAIVYIDPCINRKEVLEKIAEAFELDRYVVDSDDHYHCKKCIGKLFD